MYVDLPAMFGPVISTSCSASGSRRQSFGTKRAGGEQRLDHRVAAVDDVEREAVVDGRPAVAAARGDLGERAHDVEDGERGAGGRDLARRCAATRGDLGAEQLGLARGERLLGGQDLLLELGELGRDVALARRDRLLADVVRRAPSRGASS